MKTSTASRQKKGRRAPDRALEVVDHRAHARERGLALVVDDAALLRELLFSVLELPDEHLDGVDAAFLLQTVLGGRVDVNGAGVECEGALRDRQRRESGGAAKKQCSQDALHVWY